MYLALLCYSTTLFGNIICMEKNNRGSEWSKWDLHVHTPLSLVEKYGGDSDEVWEKFIADLEALPPEFSAIGINDYLFIDGYEKVLEYKEKGRLSNIEVIFPVIEFRIKKFGGHKDFKRINFHVIFSDKLNPEVIRQQFLNPLSGKYTLAAEVDWSGVVTKDSLSDLGAKIKSTVPKEKVGEYGTDLKEGFNNINFDEEKIFELLRGSSYLRDHFLTAIGKTEWDSFSWGDSSIAEKKSVINSVDFVFTASESVNTFNNAKAKLKEQVVNDLLIDCSDAHEFSTESSKDRIGNCNTWIKSDPTFEGLRQVIFEPEERIRIQERMPGSSKTERVLIDHVQFKNESGKDVTVYFNKDLNSIIGSRGSGKSTLLKSIANKVDPEQYRKRDKKPPYGLKGFEVIWADGQKNSGTAESPKNIFYVPQNYLSSLTYDDGDRIKERDTFLTKLLTKNSQFDNALKRHSQFVSQNKLVIEGHIEKLISVDRAIKENEVILKKQGSKTEIENELKSKRLEIKQFREKYGTIVSDEEITQYSAAQTDLNVIDQKLAILNQDRSILEDLRKNGSNVLVSDQQFNMLSSTRQESIKNELSKKSSENLNFLIQEELKRIDDQEKDLGNDRASADIIVNNLGQKIEQSQALQDLSKELGELRDTSNRIDDLMTKIESARQEKESIISELVETYSGFDSQQESIFSSVDFDETFTFLDVKVEAEYSLEQLKSFVDRYLNTRDTDPKLKEDKDIKDLLFSETPSLPSRDTIRKLINELLNGRLKFKVEAEDVSNVLSQLLRNRYEVDYLNSVKTKDGSTCFKNMTGGQKAIGLLELIFRFDDEKYPILIDQPEDDLDVGGVATDLVNFVQSEKKDRQIIIVSHNASLVVCADSEEIITSSITPAGDGKHDFSYATGSIESPGRKADIIDVLEGGPNALQKRMSKLRVVTKS